MGPFSRTTWRTSAGGGPHPGGFPAGRAPGRRPAAAVGRAQRAPVRGRPDTGRPQGDARPRADDAPELRPRRAGGRPVPRAGARGKVAVSTGSVVTIAGRAFTLGVIYAPRRGSYGRRSKPRRLLSYTADS